MNATARTFLALVATQVAHLLGEIATGFRVRFPLGEMPMPVFVLANAALYAYALFILLGLMRGRRVFAHVWAFIVILALNVAVHVGIMAVTGAYFPGGYTTILLAAGLAGMVAALRGSSAAPPRG